MTGRIFDRVAVLFANRGGPDPLRSALGLALLLVAILAALVLFGLGANAALGARNCSAECVKRVEARYVTERRIAIVKPYSAWLDRVAQCESGGDWKINTGNGYYGGLQFALTSWRAVGGTGFPHRASKLQQKYRAVRLLRLQGRGAWPVCGRR